MTASIHAYISGRVQGVCFRAATADKAHEFAIHGWVRNLPDGRVEVLAGGAEADLTRFREWLQEGPPAARVDDVQVESASPDDLPSGFSIR